MRKSLKSLMAVLLVLCLSCQLFAAEGVVTFVKGKVEVKRGNTWVGLNVGDTIKESEMINTGFQSEAKVKLMDSILYLGPVTRVTLDTLASSNDRDKVNVYLSTGSIRSKVNRTDTKRVSYTVRTPIAVASVRGTDWAIDCLNNVVCYEGAVAVIPINLLLDNLIDDDDSSDDKKSDEEDDDKKKVDSTTGDEFESNKEKEDDSKTDEEEKAKRVAEAIKNDKAFQAFEDAEDLPGEGSSLVGHDMSIKVNNPNDMGVPQHKLQSGVNDVLSSVATESTKTDGKTSITDVPRTGSIQVKVSVEGTIQP